MWTPERAQSRIPRRSSSHSIINPVAPSRPISYVASIGQSGMWKPYAKAGIEVQSIEHTERDEVTQAVDPLGRRDSISTQSTTSTSTPLTDISGLDNAKEVAVQQPALPEPPTKHEPEERNEADLKTPTISASPKPAAAPSATEGTADTHTADDAAESEDDLASQASTVFDQTDQSDAPSSIQIKASPPVPEPGPLEQSVLSLLAHLRNIENHEPTVMADDYKRLKDRISGLEAEKSTWQARHEALFALRDEDVVNLIKVRGLLAKERRQNEEIRKLRDEDLNNLVEVREKLAQEIWARERERERTKDGMRDSWPRSPRRASVRLSRNESSDLWQAAKAAAMEQRVLELERANEELRTQLEITSGGGTGNLNVGIGTGVGTGAGRIEAWLEESMVHREKMAARVQQLRSEKEALQKEVARLEDRNQDLEIRVMRLTRRVAT